MTFKMPAGVTSDFLLRTRFRTYSEASGHRHPSWLRVAIATFVLAAAIPAAAAAAPATPETGSATEITATGAKLNGTLLVPPTEESKEGGTYQFAYQPESGECEETFLQLEPFVYKGTKGESEKQKVSETAANLSPATNYTFCLIAANKEGFERENGLPVTFKTPPGDPSIATEPRVVLAGTGTAIIGAEINPSGLPTTYYAQLATEAQFNADEWVGAADVPSTPAELPAANRPLDVTESLGGLQPGTVYRFRFVATNSLGTTASVEATLDTATAGTLSLALPDGRAYELVSTSGDFGEPYEPASSVNFESAGQPKSEHPYEASASGDALAYVGEPASAGGTGEVGPGEGNQWLATRTSSGWTTGDITPANTLPATDGANFEAFSPELSTGILEGSEEPPLTTEVSPGCRSLYSTQIPTPNYHAFITGALGNCGRPLYAGASADGAQVLFQSEAALTENAEEAVEVPPGHESKHTNVGGEQGETCMFGCNLYDAVGGRLSLVNFVEGEAVPNANFGGYSGNESTDWTDFSNVISADGSRVFWTDTKESVDRVYVYENGTTNFLVSGPEPAQYWTATPDGHYAYYTEAGRLYRFDTDSNESEPLTPEAAGVLGVIGISQAVTPGDYPGEAGGYLYFVATAELTGIANAEHESADPGSPNLYLLHSGTVTFVATLSEGDDLLSGSTEFETSGDWRANLGQRTAQVTPNGLDMVFESARALTGYDNVISGTPATAVEVYVYSPSSGKLLCTSCNPTGLPPTVAETPVPHTSRLPVSLNSDTYMRRYVSENGNRVFFVSEQPLVAQLDDGVQNVYEWEREGEGSCQVRTPSSQDGGCVFLLSGGNSGQYSFLVDADATGNNVFFEHQGPLGSIDVPVNRTEIYDARVGGGFSAANSASCAGSACETPPRAAPLPLPAAATENFEGFGNYSPVPPPKPLTRKQLLAKALQTCKKLRAGRKRAACDRTAEKRYGTVRKPKAKRSRTQRTIQTAKGVGR